MRMSSCLQPGFYRQRKRHSRQENHVIDGEFNTSGVTVWAVILQSCDMNFLRWKHGTCRELPGTIANTLIQISNKILLYSIGTQHIVYYQSIKLATCFGSSNYLQANSKTIPQAHSVDVHIVGSHMESHNVHITNKLFVVFRLNIIKFYLVFVLDNTTGWSHSKHTEAGSKQHRGPGSAF